ncbi:hypothetical protein IGI04_023361 [Brassica rapa subsp. trilocularis]|uniref:Secreted protein n=1 Tax=Brassica rapa subsp. trilocularis TaxID=1813537 RepID=A0ABQ7M3P6_BRACM|nr:hypothetical protein IGI04_023361 [Brassica rapa subsp. trilocularis]
MLLWSLYALVEALWFCRVFMLLSESVCLYIVVVSTSIKHEEQVERRHVTVLGDTTKGKVDHMGQTNTCYHVTEEDNMSDVKVVVFCIS